MNDIHSILIPIDGSSLSLQSLAYAQALASGSSEITLLQVVSDHSGYIPLEIEMAHSWEIDAEARLVDEARTDLQRIAKQLVESSSVAKMPSTRVEIGDPATWILDIAEEGRFSLIVITTHAYGAVRRTLFGSVADRLVRHSSVPVLVVRPQDEIELGIPGPIQRIVVPLDGSPRAENALPFAKLLARHLGVPILLVRAIHLDFIVPRIEGTFVIPEESIEDIERFARDYLSALCTHIIQEGIGCSIVIEWGTPLEVIESKLREDDLLAMTTHGRGGISRWLLGSVAEKLVRTAITPVLLIPAREPLERGAESDESDGFGPTI